MRCCWLSGLPTGSRSLVLSWVLLSCQLSIMLSVVVDGQRRWGRQYLAGVGIAEYIATQVDIGEITVRLDKGMVDVEINALT